MANPIGITFLPSQEAQQQGPRQGQMEGDLAQAFKILSLRLPQVLGARALTPKRLLTSPGASGLDAGGASPYAAVFQALLQAALGGEPAPSYGTDVMPAFPGSTGGGMGYGTEDRMPLPGGGEGGKLPPKIHIIPEPNPLPGPGGGPGTGSGTFPDLPRGPRTRDDYPGYEREYY